MTSEALDAASAYASNFQREVGDVSRNSFLAGARWQADQDHLGESVIATVAAQRAVRVSELEAEVKMLRRENEWLHSRRTPSQVADFAIAQETRAREAEAKLAKVREYAEAMVSNDMSGWDLMSKLVGDGSIHCARGILAILDGDDDE